MSRNPYSWILDEDPGRNDLHLLRVKRNETVSVLFDSTSWNWSDLDLTYFFKDERQRHKPDVASSYRMDSEKHMESFDLKYDGSRVQPFRTDHASNKYIWPTKWCLENFPSNSPNIGIVQTAVYPQRGKGIDGNRSFILGKGNFS